MKSSTQRLYRWLDRLSAACDNKKWKSALAEADCLSAELKQVREELWQRSEGESELPASIRLKQSLSFGLRSLSIAMVIICLSTFPIAVESGSVTQVASVPSKVFSSPEELTIVTAEEKELLQLLRKNLNDSNVAVTAVAHRLPETGKTTARALVRTPASAPAPAAPKTAPAPKSKNVPTKIKAEDLLTLVQIGEKSLRGSDSAIKIID